MKFSKLFVGFVAALVLSACGGPGPAEPEMHTITFNYNYNYGEVVEGEPAPTTIEVEHGTVVAADQIPNPTREGSFAFKRWATTAACVHAFDWSKSIDKDYTVYADWVDLSNADVLTLVGSFQPEGQPDYWNPNSTTYTLSTTDGIVYTIEDVEIKQYTEWQVIKNHAWDGQMNVAHVDAETSTDIYAGTGNIITLLSAKYDITVDLSSTTPIHIELVETINDPNAAAGFEVYLVGDAFDGAAWAVNDAGKMDGPATGVVGTWTKTITLNEGGQLKLIVRAVNSEGTPSESVTWVGASNLASMPEGWSGTDNIMVTAGTYTVSYAIQGVPGMGQISVVAA